MAEMRGDLPGQSARARSAANPCGNLVNVSDGHDTSERNEDSRLCGICWLCLIAIVSVCDQITMNVDSRRRLMRSENVRLVYRLGKSCGPHGLPRDSADLPPLRKLGVVARRKQLFEPHDKPLT